MIVELIVLPFFKLISFLINLIPNGATINNGITQGFYSFLETGLFFFGSTSFCLVIATVVSWNVIHFGWAIIEWIYKKIPGVD